MDLKENPTFCYLFSDNIFSLTYIINDITKKIKAFFKIYQKMYREHRSAHLQALRELGDKAVGDEEAFGGQAEPALTDDAKPDLFVKACFAYDTRSAFSESLKLNAF